MRADVIRKELIEIGLRMLYEKGVSTGVETVRIADVAAAAAFTTSALYRYWENQEAFHRDLTAAAVSRRTAHPLSVVRPAIRRLVEERAPFREVVRVGALAAEDEYTASRETLTAVALQCAVDGTREHLSRGGGWIQEALAAFGALYEELFAAYGLRLKPPLTFDHLALALRSLTQGFLLHHICGVTDERVTIDHDDAGVGHEWTLFALAVDTLIRSWSEPVSVETDEH